MIRPSVPRSDTTSVSLYILTLIEDVYKETFWFSAKRTQAFCALLG